MSLLRPFESPHDAAARERYQLTVERIFVGSLVLFMLIAAVTFLVFPNITLYVRFSHDFHTLITPVFFFALSMVGVALAPALYLFRERWSASRKRQVSLLAISPLALYTMAVGWYALFTGGAMSFGVVIYVLFLLPYVQLPLSIYRE